MANDDPAEQLKKLSDLRAQGVLSEAEFTAAKAKVIGNAPGQPAAKKKTTNKGGCGCLTVIVIVAVIAVISGSSGSGGGGGSANAPKNFTVSNTSVAKLVTDVVNNDSSSPGLQHPPTVDCNTSASHCTIDYTIKTPAGISAGLEVVGPTEQIWKGLFEDSRFNSGLITVSGPLVSQGGKSSNGPLFSLDCNRSDADLIDWDTVTAKNMQEICTFDQMVSSL